MSLIALCAEKELNKFLLEVKFGEGHELAAEVVDVDLSFLKGVELIF